MALDNAVVITSDAPDASIRIEGEDSSASQETQPDYVGRSRDEYGRFAPADDDQTPEAGAEDEPKVEAKRGSPQERINQAIKRQRTEQRAREAAERRADDLEARLQALERGRQAPPSPEPAPRARTKAHDEPTEDQFEKYEDYIRAITDYTASQVVRRETQAAHDARQREVEAREFQTTVAAHAQRINDTKQLYEDFEEVTSRDDIAITPPMEDAILHSPLGGQMTYYLGYYPEVAQAIAKLPPGPALVAMGKLEAHLEAASSGSAPRAPVTRTPPPIQPVSGGSHASARALADLPLHEYIRVRQEQINAKRA